MYGQPNNNDVVNEQKFHVSFTLGDKSSRKKGSWEQKFQGTKVPPMEL